MTYQKLCPFALQLHEHAVRAGREQGFTTMEIALAVISCAGVIMMLNRREGVSRQAAVRLLEPVLRGIIDHAVKLDFQEQPAAGNA
jgi:hypothetical protein